MGIEMRKNGNAYYYRKRRKNGRVVSEYVAAGEFGALLWQANRLTREREAVERANRRELRRAGEALDREARDLAAYCAELAALALLATGHHRHKGTWRRRRYDPMARDNRPPSERLQERLEQLERQAATAARDRARAEAAADLPALPAPDDTSPEAARAIMARCNRADATAEDVAALRALIKRRPSAPDSMCPVAQAISNELDDRYKYPLKRELVREHVAQRRAALGYDTAPALERPLILHLILCELRMGNAETYMTAAESMVGRLTLAQSDQAERRLTATQRRYLAAVEALARVRRVRVELARVNPDGSAEAVAIERPGA